MTAARDDQVQLAGGRAVQRRRRAHAAQEAKVHAEEEAETKHSCRSSVEERTGETDRDQTATEHVRCRTKCRQLVAGLSRDSGKATQGKKPQPQLPGGGAGKRRRRGHARQEARIEDEEKGKGQKAGTAAGAV